MKLILLSTKFKMAALRRFVLSEYEFTFSGSLDFMDPSPEAVHHFDHS